MHNLELAWETFEFHVASSMNNELLLSQYKAKLRNKAFNEALAPKLKSCIQRLINDYQKQNNTLDELINIHKEYSLHGIPIPKEREVPLMYLNELKNTNATLINQLKHRISNFPSF